MELVNLNIITDVPHRLLKPLVNLKRLNLVLQVLQV